MEVCRLSALPPEVLSTNPKRRLFSWCVAYKTTLGKGNCQKGSNTDISKVVSDILYRFSLYCMLLQYQKRTTTPEKVATWLNVSLPNTKQWVRRELFQIEEGITSAMTFSHLSKCERFIELFFLKRHLYKLHLWLSSQHLVAEQGSFLNYFLQEVQLAWII